MTDAELDIRLQRSWASWYAQHLGWWPLPSRCDAKRPPLRYREWLDSPPPADLCLRRYDPPATNIQLVTGGGPRLAVLDLDGPDAVRAWETWKRDNPTQPTWEVAHDEAKGKHVYWMLPSSASGRKRILWEDAGKKHSKIELFMDRGLIVAPPSRHIKTGNPYRFLPGRGPDRNIPGGRPATIPPWLLALPDVTPKAEPRVPPPAIKPTVQFRRFAGTLADRQAVMDAIPDKVALADSWGLRLTGGGSGGWHYCYRATKEERDPSAQIHEGGVYWEPGQGSVSLFDLSVMLGVYATWQDCKNHLAELYGVTTHAHSA